MMRIARSVCPKALITNDRFHVQKLYYDALDDMRIAYQWTARDEENLMFRDLSHIQRFHLLLIVLVK